MRVKPSSRNPGLEQLDDGSWIARVRSPPVDGRANEELISLLADHLGVRRSQLSIRSGGSGRLKLIHIDET